MKYSNLHIPNQQSKKNQAKNSNDNGKINFSEISTCGEILSNGAADRVITITITTCDIEDEQK